MVLEVLRNLTMNLNLIIYPLIPNQKDNQIIYMAHMLHIIMKIPCVCIPFEPKIPIALEELGVAALNDLSKLWEKKATYSPTPSGKISNLDPQLPNLKLIHTTFDPKIQITKHISIAHSFKSFELICKRASHPTLFENQSPRVFDICSILTLLNQKVLQYNREMIKEIPRQI